MSQKGVNAQYRRTDGYVYRLTVGEHLLVSLHARGEEPFYALTPTGALLWESLAEWSTVDDLCARLSSEYEVTRDQAAVDVMDFLEQLESLQAVESRQLES
jgi:Coenzyme PQQ synthesis protein D (PqqD)